MTESAIAQTDLENGAAGRALGEQIHDQLHGERPDALIVFASSRNDYTELLEALDAACRPHLMVGCSSAGEFTSNGAGEGMACAIALRAPDIKFSASLGRGLTHDRNSAASDVVAGLSGLHTHEYRYRSALVLVDALAGHADDLVERLTLLTSGTYQFVGGGAGDDAQFRRTHVFFGTEAHSDAAVALEILSNKPVGICVRHGWKPATPPLRVTEAADMRLASLNAIPAAQFFQEHAELTQQPFDRNAPLPFFLHNVIGIRSDDEHKLRVPLGIDADGGVLCAAEVPLGTTACIMTTDSAAGVRAAADATRDALKQMAGHKPKVALFFDCVATRLRMGREFGNELAALSHELDGVEYAGCNTYGQIARAEGQFSGFHNCTAVVCILPE